MKTWASVNALYQIYPRSFKDTNGDGIGDIKGIIEQLDYLKGGERSLGVDAIWISPFYPSPMADFGYDVSDYSGVHPMFGTLDDFKELLEKAHARDIKVMIDFVPNHTSDQHPWFQEALRDPQSPKRDYYVWRDPHPDGSPPNNWMSIFGGSMWTRDEQSGQFYMHSFLKEQPDLNWENPAVREEMKQVIRFWCELGVDGFRVDAVWHISKDPDMQDNPRNPYYDGPEDGYGAYVHRNSKYGPRLFEYLAELASAAAEYPDRIMLFENYPDPAFGDVVMQYRSFYDILPGKAMPFNFEGMWLGWGAQQFGEFLGRFQEGLRPGDKAVYCFSNHDQSRIVTKFGRERARLVALMQLMLPGMPTLYYGDEIGMENGRILPHQVRDPSARDNPMGGRDQERTPMQWTAGQNAGFTTGAPWLPVANSYRRINVARELNDNDSFFTLYTYLLELRKTVPDNFSVISSDDDLLVLQRSDEKERYLIVLNFGEKNRWYQLPGHAQVVAGTHPAKLPLIGRSGHVRVGAYGGIVVKIRASQA